METMEIMDAENQMTALLDDTPAEEQLNDELEDLSNRWGASTHLRELRDQARHTFMISFMVFKEVTKPAFIWSKIQKKLSNSEIFYYLK